MRRGRSRSCLALKYGIQSAEPPETSFVTLWIKGDLLARGLIREASRFYWEAAGVEFIPENGGGAG